MFERPPPREIAELINFPRGDKYQFDNIKFYNKTMERPEKRRSKYQKLQSRTIQYQVRDKVLLKNRELPSTLEGIAKKLLKTIKYKKNFGENVQIQKISKDNLQEISYPH